MGVLNVNSVHHGHVSSGLKQILASTEESTAA